MAEDTSTRIAEPKTSTGTAQELYLGLLWLGISVYTAHATLTGSADDVSGPFGAAAAALPGLIAATLLTGATIGHAASTRFRTAIGRLLVGLGVGVVFGVVAAAGIRFAYGAEKSVMVLAFTVGAASVVGGIAAILPNDVLEAALWATTWVFFAGVIFGVLQANLTTLLGGGPNADPAAQATADLRFTYGQSALTGLIAAYMSVRKLSAERPALFWFLVAGALPGGLLLASEWLGQVGGESLVTLINGFSPGDPALVGLTDAARVRHALIVLAVGGVLSLIGGARSLAKARAEDAREAAEEAAERARSTEDDD